MRLWKFLKNVVNEMKVVTWPNAKQTRTDTSTVLGTSIIMAIFLGIIDFIVQWGLKFLA
ncbi:preprotein translocase, SecE subunit [Lentilactobacillus parafarraginis F0439]|uniref:Protein translocase subunit SecE n=1 Tax=Lentilactobacillus parafarraginis F0439 TaxID=797515 RepID=G9ZMK9_9LACO|nr:preprotein translocase subunit SecE [Lentilactobacillus parafarraginis]EHL99557.1 preprotein translocase, SecE subunit [Lentilactobacillus parafarraginis F0439]